MTEPKPAPQAKNIELIRNEDDTYTLTFDSESNYGIYELRIIFEDDNMFKRTVSLGNYVAEQNELKWDGKDNKGNPVGDEPFTAQLFLRAGEIHFDLDDIEYLYDGIKIKNLNASESSRVYYDNEEAVIDGSSTWINRLQCTDEDERCHRVEYIETSSLVDAHDQDKVMLIGRVTRKNGIDSYVGITMRTDNGYSDGLMMDVWSFDPDFNTYNVTPKKAAAIEAEKEVDVIEIFVEPLIPEEITVVQETESIETVSETIVEEPIEEITAETIDEDYLNLPEAVVEEIDLPEAVVVENTDSENLNEGEWFYQNGNYPGNKVNN